VADNIRFGRPDASDAEVARAAELALASEFIGRLPEGFATLIGERGVTLSGGQRQRIAIARAILRGAPLLLLDEATSAVDSEIEAEIHAALSVLVEGRTTIAVAHRLSTIANADMILVLHHGEVVERGTHRGLLDHRGRYATLWRLQAGDSPPLLQRAG